MPGGAIAVASDHAGFDLKEILKRDLQEAGHEVLDLGTNSTASVDYPDFGKAMGEAIASGKAARGVLVCGSGIGMAIAANKVRGVRAANVVTPEFAALAREHNDANVIALSGRFVSEETNERILNAFLTTDFGGGRHAGRVEKIMALEQVERA